MKSLRLGASVEAEPRLSPTWAWVATLCAQGERYPSLSLSLSLSVSLSLTLTLSLSLSLSLSLLHTLSRFSDGGEGGAEGALKRALARADLQLPMLETLSTTAE